MQKNIELVIQPSGEITVEAVGFTGMDCEKATAFLEETLGKVAKRKHKVAYYCRTPERQHQELGGNAR